MFPKLPQKMHHTNQKLSHQFIEAHHTVGTLEKRYNVPWMMFLRWGTPQKSPACGENVWQNVGVVGFEPRTPSLEHTCLPTRVQSNALMRWGIPV